MRMPENILVTGGCGFIGSMFVKQVLIRTEFTGRIVNVDKLTYAANKDHATTMKEILPDHYTFIQNDIKDTAHITRLIKRFEIDTIVHFAAETHVDRSILSPYEFMMTNAVGTQSLLDAARTAWKDREDVRFHHVSTDEVFGSIAPPALFTERSPYNPTTPYAASKAASDHIVRSYYKTYGLPVTISNCGNNFGPYQYREKLIPKMLYNMMFGQPLTIHGKGGHIRSWISVQDHCRAIWTILTRSPPGESYVVGSLAEWRTTELVHMLCALLSKRTGVDETYYKDRIIYIDDRPGNDLRYALDTEKLSRLGWRLPLGLTWAEYMKLTVNWYYDHYRRTECMN